jgi:hypothetical protein
MSMSWLLYPDLSSALFSALIKVIRSMQLVQPG